MFINFIQDIQRKSTEKKKYLKYVVSYDVFDIIIY